MYETVGVPIAMCMLTTPILMYFIDRIQKRRERLDDEGGLADRPLNRVREKRATFAVIFAWYATGFLLSFFFKRFAPERWSLLMEVITSPGGAIITSSWIGYQIFWISRFNRIL